MISKRTVLRPDPAIFLNAFDAHFLGNRLAFQDGICPPSQLSSFLSRWNGPACALVEISAIGV